MTWLLFLLLSTFAATSTGAEIYKWTLPNGEVEFSDRPPQEGAQPLELRPLVTIPALAAPAPPEAAQAEPPANSEGYDSFTIASPANDATVRSPGIGNLSLSFSIVPGLNQGHAIEVFMDGRSFGRSENSAVTLNNVDRGTHQIQAAIVDDNGAEVARTESITVHMHR
jgi:hypothetical protein